MDIPGELQQDAIDKLEDGTVDKEEVLEAYNKGIGNDNSIREKLDSPGGTSLSDQEEIRLYLYQYLAADRVIILLNLHKFINRKDLDPVLTTDLIEKVCREKRCLLLVTAADEIGYDPDRFRSGPVSNLVSKLSVSNRMIDLRLDDHVKSGNLPPGAKSSDAKRYLRIAKENDASIFSVAVPAGTQGIDIEDGHIKTQGFSNVVHWLFKT